MCIFWITCAEFIDIDYLFQYYAGVWHSWLRMEELNYKVCPELLLNFFLQSFSWKNVLIMEINGNYFLINIGLDLFYSKNRKGKLLFQCNLEDRKWGSIKINDIFQKLWTFAVTGYVKFEENNFRALMFPYIKIRLITALSTV